METNCPHDDLEEVGPISDLRQVHAICRKCGKAMVIDHNTCNVYPMDEEGKK